MGCDIHTLCQVKKDGQWIRNQENIFPDRVNDPLNVDPCGARWYDWFAVLANVRNSQGLDVISEPRGFPEGISIDEDNNIDGQWMGDHSFSWLTLEDFDAFDFNKRVSVKRGIIPLEVYKKLRGTGEAPEGWCGAISGADIKTVSEKDADKILDSGQLEHNIQYHVSYSWTIIYSEWLVDIYNKWTLPMRELKNKFEDVRIIFGFDN